jgi:hypothetical protein
VIKCLVKRPKSLQACLKELEPFVRNAEHLRDGRPFKRAGGLRSREVLANWLLCVAGNFENLDDRLTFASSDRLGGDGIIYNSVTEEAWPMEHVSAGWEPGAEAEEAEALIWKAISRKQCKGGMAYASGKTLVVFLDAAGKVWFPNRLAKQLPETLYFGSVWVVSLQRVEAGEYVYSVTLLELNEGNVPTWLVRIGKDFDAWEVERVPWSVP